MLRKPLRKPVAGSLPMDAGGTAEAVSSVMLQGGVAVYPSDTVYGLLADGFSEAACRKLHKLKGYGAPRPFILLVPSVDDALVLTSEKTLRKEMERHWPGPVTLVVPASDEVPDMMVGGTGGVALRLPDHWFSGEILRRTGLFLASTSANLTGEPFPLSLEDVPPDIIDGADIAVDGGTLEDRRPSRIIDLTGGSPVVVR